jgi:hypothetical protein
MLAARFGAIAAAVGEAAAGTALLGAWPLSETSGNSFADSVGSNDATLSVPGWAVPTHEYNRPGIVAGTDHALEVGNGGPAIPMHASYKQAAMSLVVYVEARSEQRGTQYWDLTDARWGREFIAFCDDGATPGSFALERRLVPSLYNRLDFASWQWRLDGYVRNADGTAVRFSGGLEGLAGALLPIDTAKRVVLTQGPDGAKLFLDGAQVAHLPAVNQGWAALTTPITLGSSSHTGHANDRSPLWGRLDQIEVWQGQLSLSEVQARPAAVQSLLYRIPTDGPLVNITDHGGNLQNAVNAAAAVSGYVYQDAGDPTWYEHPSGNDVNWSTNCRGMVGMRIKKPNGESIQHGRVIDIDTIPPAGFIGGYKLIGCRIDGNGRGQNWHPRSGTAGFAFTAFDLQQSHAVRIRSGFSGQFIPISIDACEFHDGTGDAISIYNKGLAQVRSCRFYGYFRGPIVINADGDTEVDARRFESFAESRMRPGVFNGCGMCDIEPFGGGVDPGGYVRVAFSDAWADSDFDEASRQLDPARKSWSRFRNVHVTGSAMQFKHDASSAGNQARPISEVFFNYGTLSYWRRGHGGGNFPPVLFGSIGPGDAGLGLLCEATVFIANGDPYAHHEDSLLDPATDSTQLCEIIYSLGASGSEPGGRKITLRDCEFRAKNLPAGLTQANRRCFTFNVTFPAAFEIEFDGVLVDGTFADIPFNLGGATIRYRDVLHERTGNPKPWSNVTAEVPL